MLIWGLLLFECIGEPRGNFDVYLQPGHANPDYDSVEEVKAHNDTTTEKVVDDEHLIQEAVLDVAYYLRRFKFSGFDPRFLAQKEQPQQNLFVEFPNPQLRNIHWEVKKNCEPSFVECVKYLQEQVSQTILPRHLDSLTIIKRNGWSLVTDKVLIKSADDECLKLLEKDTNTFDVFSSALQRFQWLTSASYYMCWYTMNENRFLRTFSEDCDNFASCFFWRLGLNNRDPRADNKQPFACAQYSFCPDPCCPIKYVADKGFCQKAGPCSSAKIKECVFLREKNLLFEALIQNQWNVTCHCDQKGMRWESKSGMCVDVDECVESNTSCDYPSESCKNLPGSFKCVCSPLGYRNNNVTNLCEEDVLLQKVFSSSRSTSYTKTRSDVPRKTATTVEPTASTASTQHKQNLNRTKYLKWI